MKIIRIIPFLDYGGVEQRIKLTALAFQLISEAELTVIVLGHGGHVSGDLESKGIKPIILEQPIKIPNIKLILKLYQIFNQQAPDIVHCSGAEANFHGLIAAKLAGVRVKIGEEIGFPNHKRLWRLIFKITYLFADKVVGISKSVVDNIVTMGEVPTEKTCVVYNPVDIEQVSTPILPKLHQFTFITVCRLVPIKNIEGLLKAFSQFLANKKFDMVQLNIVGSGPEHEKLVKLCDTLQISTQVTFLGFQIGVNNYLKQADAFVLPSFSEGFSISLVEAMLCGLPSIVTKMGGPSEIIEQGKSGFLIDPYCTDSLVNALECVYEMSKEERLSMGSIACKDALDRFSVQRYVDDLQTLYKFDE